MVNVYKDGEFIATVKVNNNLDIWDGSNFQNGGTGRHLGITKLEDGTFVLIYSSDWQSEMDSAEVITPKKAYEVIMRYDESMLEWKAFKELKCFQEELVKEVELQ